jgi:putative transposase
MKEIPIATSRWAASTIAQRIRISRFDDERAMQRFLSMKTLQKFSSVHAQAHNQFNQERHLITWQVYEQRRSIALTE